jgi:hypothetical protein
LEGSRPRSWRPRRWGNFPTERDWQHSVVLQPVASALEPAFVSDGSGLPFAPSALTAPAGRLDPGDSAVDALAAQLSRQPARADGSRPQLREWRLLARTETDVLFAWGVPPDMITVAMTYKGRRDGWRSVAITRDVDLRVTRDGIRASSWEIDESHPPAATDTIIRILVTEQTRSGGKLADKRLLTPDLHEGEDEVTLRVFVQPRPGVQMAASALQTPARIQLPTPLGDRDLVDGALY